MHNFVPASEAGFRALNLGNQLAVELDYARRNVLPGILMRDLHRLGAQAVEIAHQYAWENIAARIIQLYRKLVPQV